MKILFKDCQLVSPELEMDGASVLVEDGKIKRIYAFGDTLPEADEVVNVNGDYLMPGFIDVHCHGNSGVDFSDATDEAITAIAKAKLKEGVTTLLPTTLTLGEDTLAKTLQTAANYKAAGSPGCSVPGVHLEGPFINPDCLGAQNPAFVRKPDIAEVMRLNKIYPVLKVSYAIEMEGGDVFSAELAEHGICASCVHSAATYSQFAAAYAHGLRNLSHFCNQMTPLKHREIGLVGAGFAHDDVYIEFICDKLHICPEMIDLTFSIKGCDHILLITDAMRAAGMPDGDSSLGGLPVIVKNGEARLKSNGALAGSTLKLNRALRNVAEITGYPLGELVKTTSWNQAKTLGITDLGKIEPGFKADIVILDGEFEVQSVYIGGVKKL